MLDTFRAAASIAMIHRKTSWKSSVQKSIGGGHKYVTIVMDLESGAIIFVGKGKGQNAFYMDRFFAKYRFILR